MSLKLTNKDNIGNRSRIAFSGTDFIPIVVLAGEYFYDIPLTTITLSFAVDKVYARGLGQVTPKSQRMNQVTVAGTFISILRNASPFASVIKMLRHDSYMGYNRPLKSYEIPPFDIIMLGVNESGAMTYSSIVGASILQGGYTFSINDAYSEVVLEYKALDFFEPIVINVREGAEESFISGDILYRHYDIFGLMTTEGVYVSRILGMMQTLRRKIMKMTDIYNDPNITEETRKQYDKLLDDYNREYEELALKLEDARKSYRFNELQTYMMSDNKDAVRFADERIWGAAGKSTIGSAYFASTGIYEYEETIEKYLEDISEPIPYPEYEQFTADDITAYERAFRVASQNYYNGLTREAYALLLRLENKIYNKYPADVLHQNNRIRQLLLNIETMKDKIRSGAEFDSGR